MNFFTFDELRADRPETAAETVEILTRSWERTVGFVSARVHLGLDGLTVVNLGRWTDETAYRDSPAGQTPGTVWVKSFGGTQARGIEGPAVATPPGITSVMTRRVGGHESARLLVELMCMTGEWKSQAAGFISATPYLSADGGTFVSYSQWVDVAAYGSYMADPRIAEGQAEIAHSELAPPEYVLCEVATEIQAPEGGGDVDVEPPQ